MELQGRILRVLGESSGTNQQGNPWRKLEYLFGFYENPSDIYERSIVLSFMNDHVDTNKGYNVGDIVRVRVAMKCREYPQGSGRYFNDIYNGDLMMVQRGTPATGAQNQPAQAANQQAVGQQPAAQQQGQQQAPFPPQVDENGNPITNQGGDANDGLPF